MILRLTQTGHDFFQGCLLEMVGSYKASGSIGDCPKIDGDCHFVYLHSEVDESGNINTTKYHCHCGEDMVVADTHYANSPDLQHFVNQEYLEIV